MAFASSSDGKVSEPSIQPSHPCRRFEFSEILRATDNFAESLVIGKGGFGKVYKGNIMNGSSLSVAAIKRSDSISGQGAAEFWTEVEMLSMLRHCNLVSLIGYCIHEKEMILVYDYMPNGTLNDHLHKHHTPLSWLQRLNICIGVGRGLHYLHTGTGIGTGVIHRDVKSTNILLHESWAAKLSDFGLSKVGKTDQPVSTFVKGTFGYMDPSYFQTGKLTSKSDVYAFGVVMLEVLCRKRAVISLGETQQSLATWGLDSIKEGNLKHIVDSDIMGEISPKCLKKFVRIADRCLHDTPELRPTMAEVVFSLESTLVFQEKFNVKTGPISITVVGRIAQGIKAFAEGGYENIFAMTFETVPDEKLVKYYACYISTSAGPVMGILYLSTAKLAFCSDNPLSYKVGEETQWSYYKVVISLHQLLAVNASKSKAKPLEKYIQIISVDSHEFWFMGFVNYDSAVQNLQGALQSQCQV